MKNVQFKSNSVRFYNEMTSTTITSNIILEYVQLELACRIYFQLKNVWDGEIIVIENIGQWKFSCKKKF